MPESATREHLTSVQRPRLRRRRAHRVAAELAVSNDLPGWDEGLARAVCARTGGVVAAALHVLEHRTVAGSLSSGLHHARYASGWGYCTVNGSRDRRPRVARCRRSTGAGARPRRPLRRRHRRPHPRPRRTRRPPPHRGLDGVEQVDVSVDPFDYYGPHERTRLLLTDGPRYLQTVQTALTASTTRRRSISCSTTRAWTRTRSARAASPASGSHSLVGRRWSSRGSPGTDCRSHGCSPVATRTRCR